MGATLGPEVHDSLSSALIATAVDGIIVIDEHGIVQLYNQACERLFQYRPEEAIGQNVKMLMPQPYRDEHDDYLKRYADTRERRIIGIGREVVGRRKDGTTFPMYLSVGEAMVQGRRRFVGILHDLSELKSEAAIHEKTLRELAAIVESSEDAILSKTLDGIVTSWNAAAERMFGYSAQEMIGSSIERIFPDDRVAEEDLMLEQVRSGHSVQHYATVRKRKDGSFIDISLSVSPIYDSDGNIVGASKIARDITERKLAEGRLRELQSEMAHFARLSEMGQLASAIAHELNQPLAATMNYVNAARRMLETSGEGAQGKAGEFLEKAAGQAQRAGKIIRHLRNFIEKRETSRTPEDVNFIVEDAIALGILGAADVNVALRTDLQEGGPAVRVDRVQIQQVLVNLLRNAVESMQGSERQVLTISSRFGGEYVEIAVADSGVGISPEVAERLFEPFVTTKSTGMGIGLMICRSIVEAHGGRIWVAPNPGGGTVFRFRLPLNAGNTQNDR